MARDIALLVNPSSRAGGTAVRLLRVLRARGARVTVVAGRSFADSERLARDATRRRPDALVAVGGDGLVNAALQAVVGTDVPLGIVPAGTGNDIAREFRLPRSVPAAAGVVLRGHTVAADTVRAAGRHFLSVLACGFDARVNERVNGFRRSLGRADYLVGLLAELGSFAPIRFTVDVDGQRMLSRDGMLVAVGNTSSYGGGMRVCPDAAYDDGLLEVVFVHAVSRGRFLRFFPNVLTGAHTRLDEVTAVRGRTVTVRADAAGADGPGVPVVGYADGERLAPTPITCEVVRASVRVLS